MEAAKERAIRSLLSVGRQGIRHHVWRAAAVLITTLPGALHAQKTLAFPAATGEAVPPSAIAGLLNNIGQEDKAAIPILSKLPIIGAIFKSKANREERTELMVLITPRLVRPLNPDEVPPLPTIIKKEGGKGDTSSSIKGGAGLIDGPSQPEASKSGRR